MSSADWTEILFFTACLILLAPLVGRYCFSIYRGRHNRLTPALGWVEGSIYRILSLDPKEEMRWTSYLKALLLFNGFGCLFLFLLLLLQNHLLLNPQGMVNLSWISALTTAISFTTNTGWEGYAAETSLSYLSQMLGITVQNFLSAATGIAVLFALMRGLSGHNGLTVGNFYADVVRITLYLLLPLACVLSLLLMSQGVVQTFHPYVEVVTLEGEKQVIPLGPAASQVAIKQLSSDGGGFFRANSAHPFENPTRVSNFLETLSMLLLPASFPFLLGHVSKALRFGWLLFFVMLALWGCSLLFMEKTERMVRDTAFSNRAWLEGKEQRLGLTRSVLWSNTTTAVAHGSTNAALGSLGPLSIGISLFNMLHGNAAFGAAGTGMCSMLMFCLMASVVASSMVGRTAEFLGKKIGRKELHWSLGALFLPMCMILMGTAAGLLLFPHQGPRAFTELLYLLASSLTNNGSALNPSISISAYGVLSVAMLLGRLLILIPSLALAGTLVKKNLNPLTASNDYMVSPAYGCLLFSIILLSGLLPFLPALSLGPILEHFILLYGEGM